LALASTLIAPIHQEEFMPLVDYWKLVVIERYAQFDGRARRAEYWWFWLANLIVFAILLALAAASSFFYILYAIYALGVIIPNIAVGIRRLHDTDRSGWWLLLPLIPFVGFIILLVFLLQDGTRGLNQYGASDKYPNG
jgi:uncharacterized membrane protein YhaH (DUF805 family)